MTQRNNIQIAYSGHLLRDAAAEAAEHGGIDNANKPLIEKMTIKNYTDQDEDSRGNVHSLAIARS